MPQLVPPHNSEQVKPLLLPETERAEERKRAATLRKIPLNSRAVSDVFMLAMGAYTPLDGFMGHDDWRGSCLDMKLAGGVFWPIPITLPVAKDLAEGIRAEEEVTLVDAESGEILAVMAVHEKYSIDKKIEAEHVYRTADPKHPGVAKVLAQGDVNLAGRVMVLSEGEYPAKYPELYIRPAQSRAMFLERGWSQCRRLPDPQSDAPQPRVPGQDRGRGHGRGLYPSGARQVEGRRHSGRRAHPRHPGDDR